MNRPYWRYYAAIHDAARERYGLILGPYRTRRDARANVDRARTLVIQASPWAEFGAFSVTRLAERKETVFGR